MAGFAEDDFGRDGFDAAAFAFSRAGSTVREETFVAGTFALDDAFAVERGFVAGTARAVAVVALTSRGAAFDLLRGAAFDPLRDAAFDLLRGAALDLPRALETARLAGTGVAARPVRPRPAVRGFGGAPRAKSSATMRASSGTCPLASSS